MRYHSLIPLTAALANLVICALVARQGLHDRLRRTFLWFVLAIVSWNLDIFCLDYFTDPGKAEWWSRVFRVGICLAPATTLHFGLTLSESSAPVWRTVRVTSYALGVFLALANLRGLLVAHLVPFPWGWFVAPAPLYHVLTGSLIVCAVLWSERVWRAYRHPASSRQRVQAKFWLLATLVQILFALTNVLSVYHLTIYPLGDVGTVLFTGIVAYAMLRHRLMDVDYIVRKGVSFAAAAGTILVPGAVGLMMLARASGIADPVVFVCAAEIIVMLAVVIVPGIQGAIETRVHRTFFRSRYDARRRLRALAAELMHVLDHGELVRRLGAGLTDILDVVDCEVFVRDEETRRLVLESPTTTEDRRLPDPLAPAVERLGEPVLAGELEAREPALGPPLRARGWEVLVPLRIDDRLIGLIALGRNRDFRIFSAEDLRLLADIESAATVALENSRLSRQLRRSEAVLERANRLSSLGTLAGGIAHEIRNPLVAVKTFLDLLPERLHDTEFLVNFRNLSLSELRRVTDLISDLLSLGKTTATGRQSVALADTLEPVVRLMESTAHKRGIRLVQEVEPGLPQAWADPDRVKQIVLNLLLNAIEASDPGAQVRLHVGTGATPGGARRVVLEVRDEGPGIPPEQLDDIFLPFFTTKDGGTGLGLALVHQMVAAHGGEITVESTPGGGTCFRVTLPAADADLAGTGT